MLYLVMGKRTPISQDYYEWPRTSFLEEALVNPSIMPARFFDRTLIQNFLDTTEALTPKSELDQRKIGGYVDYIFDTSHSPIVTTCMIYRSKAEYDMYYDSRIVLHDNFKAARNALLNLFNLELASKNCIMADLNPSDIPDINVWEIFHDPNIPNEID